MLSPDVQPDSYWRNLIKERWLTLAEWVIPSEMSTLLPQICNMGPALGIEVILIHKLIQFCKAEMKWYCDVLLGSGSVNTFEHATVGTVFSLDKCYSLLLDSSQRTNELVRRRSCGNPNRGIMQQWRKLWFLCFGVFCGYIMRVCL
jgi:hypothetical protein